MLYTEELMAILYKEALANGTADRQIQKLAEGNHITEGEVMDILQRSGYDMGNKVIPTKEIPEVLFELAEEKLEDISKEIEQHTRKLTELETQKEELEDFLRD